MQRDLLAVIRNSHWVELAEFLGQPIRRVQETLQYYLKLLDNMGYELVRKGEAPAPETKVSPTEVMPLDRMALFHAVEGAIMETTERRLAGDRISDQAEVRAIVNAVIAELTDASAGVRPATV